MQVICHGRLRAYEPQGVYQLYVESVTPAGAGDLHQQYEALRQKLAAEGLFADERKRPIPRWPRRIGVATSPVGAVWRDIGNVMRRRWPLAELVLSPTIVQGPTAAGAIVRALQRLYAQPDLDLIILARGGGSLEDLWSFNDEKVVRAVVAAPMPVIVGVGHESDVTLADFAADLRAPTPSAAAEQAVPDATQLPAILARLRDRASAALLGAVDAQRKALDGERRALASLAPDAATARQRAADLVDRGHRALSGRLERDRLGLRAAHDALRALGPQATLERGYAVARTADGSIVRDPAQVTAGQPLAVVVARGTIATRVERAAPDGTEDLLS
jgi:exodeoxyribonuclease VII large subunit